MRPWVSAATVKQRIVQSARKLPALQGKVSAGLVDARAALAAFLHPQPQDKPKKDKAPINKKLEERKKNLKARHAQRQWADPEMPHTFQHNLDTTRDNRPAPARRSRQNQCAPACRI